MTYFDYRDSLFDICGFAKGSVRRWRNLLELTSEMLKKYLGFDEISPSSEDDVACPFDLWGISHKTLYLIKLDEECYERDDEALGINEIHGVLDDLLKFVRASSAEYGESNIHNTRAVIAELISKLAHGETDKDIERIKIVTFLFNPLSGECGRETSMRIKMLKCNAQAMSLYSLWQEGIQIPQLAEEIPDESEEKTSADEFVETVVKPQESFSAVYKREEDLGPSISNAEEYKQQLISEARQRKGFFHFNLFDDIVSELCDSGEYEEIYTAHSERTYSNRPFAVDGWALDETNNVLTLFLLDNKNGDDSFIKEDLDKQQRRLKNFAEFSIKGCLSDDVLDLSTEEGSLTYRIEHACKREDSRYNRIEFVILTMRSKAFKAGKESLQCEGIECRISVLDYRDLYQLTEATRNTRLEINFLAPEFGGKPVQMISAVNRPDIGYKAYVGKIRADVLADIYEEYGQKVLSSNVRAFLLTAGKVNKGIQKTIREEPDNFFAYNNGICVVASDIKADDRDGITLMGAATDFQIVNGGQTTASLHYAKKKKVPISQIYVPLKLSVVPENIDDFDRQLFVQNISAYANSQNKVSDSDLGTNTHFQIKFQRAGEGSTILMPGGSVCKWYYERARGTYKIERIRTREGSSKNSKFERQYPQKFDKTELAKWFKAWSDEPHIANVGGQKCFIEFSKDLIEKEKKDKELSFCTADFFKYAVGKGILYRHIDLRVQKSDWYQAERSYKVNIVGYTMAMLRLVIADMFPGEELDFLRLWQTQNIPGTADKIRSFDPMSKIFSGELDSVIDSLAKYCRSIFDDDRRTVSDVGEWVKKQECWNLMKQDMPRYDEYRENLRHLCGPINPNYVIKSWRTK